MRRCSLVLRLLALLLPCLLAAGAALDFPRAAPRAAPPAAQRAAPPAAQRDAGRRVALVMGNSAYTSVAPLANPANDARLMAEVLKTLGFELVGGRAQTDLAGKADMEQAVQRFGELVKGAAVGLFFYAGHGVQVDGKNYLVPVKADVSARTQIKYQLLDADFVLDEMSAAGTQVNLVVLDACRNNPFGDRGMRAVSSGLAQIMAPKGTLVAYSTAPGRTATDGTGRNSPFSAALARHIKTPGLRIDDVFMQVGAEVERQTGGAQSPWKSDNLRGVFCLAGQCGQGPAPAAGAAEQEARLQALQKELAEKTAQAEEAKALAARAQGPAAADQAQFARPDALGALDWDASWRLGVFRNRAGASYEAGLDEQTRAEGSARSFRVDYSFPPGTEEYFANASTRKRRDLSGFSGVEFRARATGPLVGHLNLVTSQPDNPKAASRHYGSFKMDGTWRVVRIPFDQLSASRYWEKHAARSGFTPGDQVLRVNRVEELRIGVDPTYNPPGTGSFWLDSLRFYK